MDKVHQNNAYEEQTGVLTNSLKWKSEGGYNTAIEIGKKFGL